MGKIISLVEYRRKRCIEALMQDIGVPDYCHECGDDIETLLMQGMLQQISAEIPHDHVTHVVTTSLESSLPPRKRSSARKH